MPKSESRQWKSPFHDHIPEESREHVRAAHEELRKGFASFFPPEFMESRRAARKEMLLAAREFLNQAIDRIDEKEKA